MTLLQQDLGIREVSDATGISVDTLRWYEKEGLLPLVERSSDGRRRYPPAAVRFVRLVQALRRTGMPVAEVREFVQLGGGELANHGPRTAVLQRQAARIDQQLADLEADRAVLAAKIADYQRLVALGLDCEDATADAAVRAAS